MTSGDWYMRRNCQLKAISASRFDLGILLNLAVKFITETEQDSLCLFSVDAHQRLVYPVGEVDNGACSICGDGIRTLHRRVQCAVPPRDSTTVRAIMHGCVDSFEPGMMQDASEECDSYATLWHESSAYARFDARVPVLDAQARQRGA
jgi:hypothetical protein